MAHENSRIIGYCSKEINNFDSHIVCTKKVKDKYGRKTYLLSLEGLSL
jgi:hypothetical protein